MAKKIIGIAIVIIVLVTVALNIQQAAPGAGGKGPGQGGVAIIYVEGAILGGRSDSFFGSGAGSTTVMEQLREAARDPWVKAVVLRMNTPGGSVAASQEIGDEIQKLRETGKVVVTSMGDVAASGGYWLATHTDLIVANPATITGSIGVIMNTQNWEELFDKIGISQDSIKSGELKDIGSPARQMKPEERELLQAMVDDMFEQFVQVVMAGRDMNREQVVAVADGRIFTGKQALELGLVDELGNFYDAIGRAAQLAGLPEDPPVREMGKTSPFAMLFNQVLGKLNGQNPAGSPPPGWKNIW